MELQRDLKRRDLLRSVAMAGVGLGEMQAQEAIERATRGQSALRVKDLSVIATQPANVRLVVVKVTTDQAGLYGYGCATYTQRADLVVAAFEKYLKPFLLGKPADRIDDTWQALYNSSYWRNGPVLNNAISGVDQALWDIKGRQAGMPACLCISSSAANAVRRQICTWALGGETRPRSLTASAERRLQATAISASMSGAATCRKSLRGRLSGRRMFFIRRRYSIVRVIGAS